MEKSLHISSRHSGFTLIELMVAVALFVVVMASSVSLFNRAIDGQRGTAAAGNLYESGDYALRFMANELTGAREELAGCGGCASGDRYFCNTGGAFYFRNSNNICERFEETVDEDDNARLALWRGDTLTYLTPGNISISNLLFDVVSIDDPTYPGRKVSVRFTAAPSIGKEVAPIDLQTSLYIAADPFVCGQTITDRDNFQYPTVKINDQCWLAENLRTKTKSDGTCVNDGDVPPCPDADETANDIGRACYDDDEGNCATDGALYTFTGAMSPDHHEGDQGICPLNWHMPTDAEWHDLEQYLTDPENTCDAGRTGTEDCSSAGAKLQLADENSFRAILAGNRSGSTYQNKGTAGYFWSSTEVSSDTAWRRGISGNDLIDRREPKAGESFSVRCLKNS